MKENKTFNLVSAGLSALVLILIFALDFVKFSALGIDSGQGATAWELFTGKNGGEGIGIAFLIVIAVILLAVNIILQFVEVKAVTDFAKGHSEKPANVLVNNIVGIAAAALILIVGLMAPGALKDAMAKEARAVGMDGLQSLINIKMTMGAWFMVIISAAMVFLPKIVSKKTLE